MGESERTVLRPACPAPRMFSHLCLFIYDAIVFRKDCHLHDEGISRCFKKKPGKIKHVPVV